MNNEYWLHTAEYISKDDITCYIVFDISRYPSHDVINALIV